MAGETDIDKLLKNMNPVLNPGSFVFSSVKSISNIPSEKIIGTFREKEGITVIVKKEIADQFNLTYDYLASWITLEVHSSLNAIGLTAAFSKALAQANISCNVMAGYYHDHIFVGKEDEEKAMGILKSF
ncbi:ACT domain-containing protein [Flexithrix dorotheae]|uniref:ACT domain-containing protein n=1 Tax=Flexithrix dorotheae TaxID=70993 RepID=UPI0003716795|nr:ACT domain-containing protein [Flexithrix dorotheae]